MEEAEEDQRQLDGCDGQRPRDGIIVENRM